MAEYTALLVLSGVALVKIASIVSRTGNNQGVTHFNRNGHNDPVEYYSHNDNPRLTVKDEYVIPHARTNTGHIPFHG